MSAIERPRRHYLGRPNSIAPGHVPDEPRVSFETARAADRSGLLWLVKAVTGALLIFFLGLHLIAQHLLVPEGLRDFASVVDYLKQPFALATETLLVATVLVHVAIATRTFAAELVRGARALRVVTLVIAVVAVATFGYTIWLTVSVLSWSE